MSPERIEIKHKDEIKKLTGMQLSKARAERTREFQAALKQFSFVRDTLPSAQAIASDSLLPNVQRVLQWIKNCAWGRFSLCCVLEDGNLAFAADCARELKIDPGSVSRTLHFLEARGYILRVGPSKKIYLIPDPKLSLTPERLANDGQYAEFIESWKVANQTSFHEFEAAAATYMRFRKMMLAEYRAHLTAGRKAAVAAGRDFVMPGGLEVVPTPPRPPEVDPEILKALKDAVPADEAFTLRTAADLVQRARRTAAAHNETLTDAEIAEDIREAAGTRDRRKIRHIGYFKTALPDRVEARIEKRRASREHDRKAAQKCPRCHGSGRHPQLIQQACDDCGGTGLPKTQS